MKIIDNKYNLGYTLLEIMIVFSILAAISMLGFASYTSYSRNQAINQAALDISNAIEKAKYSTVSSVKPNGCTGALQFYQFEVNDSRRYSVIASCIESGDIAVIDQQTLPPNISFDPDTLGCTINFAVLTNVVSGSCFSGGIADIEVSGYRIDKTVRVDSSGNTSIQ